MATTHRSDLIDELEKALTDEAYDGGMGALSPEQFTSLVRTLASTAASVVEKVHAPTDDELEALTYLITAHRFRERGIRGVILEPDLAIARPLAEFILGEGFRRSEAPKPRGDLAAVVLPEVDWDRFPHLDTEEKRRAYVYALAAMESGGMISPIPPEPERGSAALTPVRLPEGYEPHFTVPKAGTYLIDARGATLIEPDVDDEPCTAQLWSWDYFVHHQVDAYWMRCDKLGPHDEHENSETGATWPAALRAAYAVTGLQALGDWDRVHDRHATIYTPPEDRIPRPSIAEQGEAENR